MGVDHTHTHVPHLTLANLLKGGKLKIFFCGWNLKWENFMVLGAVGKKVHLVIMAFDAHYNGFRLL